MEFLYDGFGRRRIKKVYSWNSSTNSYDLSAESRFAYDGLYILAETDSSGNLVRNYVRNGSEILSATDTSGTYVYYTDGNKNVTDIANSSGTVVAHYEYSPFGGITAQTGTYAGTNPFRFSSEYYDAETGLVAYLFRYYSPEFNRWLSRDPIQEKGGYNLYAMASNNTVNKIDYLGKMASGINTDDPECPSLTASLKAALKALEKAYNKREGIIFTGDSWTDIAQEVNDFFPMDLQTFGEYSMDKMRDYIASNMISMAQYNPNDIVDIIGDTVSGELYNSLINKSLRDVFKMRQYPSDACRSSLSTLASVSGIGNNTKKITTILQRFENRMKRDCKCSYSELESEFKGWIRSWDKNVKKMEEHMKDAQDEVIIQCKSTNE